MKNRIIESKIFVRNTSATQIKKTQNRRLKDNCMEHTFKINSDQKDDLVIYSEFFSQADIICFWTTCHNF